MCLARDALAPLMQDPRMFAAYAAMTHISRGGRTYGLG